MDVKSINRLTGDLKKSPVMPVLFVGHGNPMNAITDNAFTRKLTDWGREIEPVPNAILVISAHWLTQGSKVQVIERPETIHDFGGFPHELYLQQYPAKGSPEFGHELATKVKSTRVTEDTRRGLDHGVWTVLKYMYPKADIPVFQLSIDYYQPPEYHVKLAAELKSLRDKGVLIIGSGNIVHNLYQVNFSDDAKPYDWAIEFDETVKKKLLDRDFTGLIRYRDMGAITQLAVPTNDHYLPMMYTLGVMDKHEELEFVYEEIQNASVSMRCFQIG